MSSKELGTLILESIHTFGPLAIPEISYLFNNYFEWIFKVDFKDSSNLNQERVSKILNKLHEKKKIREYLCDSGYRRRFGISKIPFSIDFPLNLRLNIKLIKCPTCLSLIIKYFDKSKHLFPFLCENRENKDNSNIEFYSHKEKKYLIYKELFLGIFEKGVLRLPYRDYAVNKPELFIAIDLYNKCRNDRAIIKLKLHIKEDIF